MKHLLKTLTLGVVIALTMASCHKFPSKEVNPSIKGSLKDFVSISSDDIEFDGDEPEIEVVFKIKKVDLGADGLNLMGPDETEGPVVMLLDKDGGKIRKSEMTLSHEDLEKLYTAILSGKGTVEVTFEAQDWDMKKVKEMQVKAYNYAIFCDAERIHNDANEIITINDTSIPVIDETGDPTPTTIQVTGNHVRLRMSPSLSGAIYSDASGNAIYPNNGDLIECIGQTPEWYRVRYNGNVLYISRQFAKPYYY